MHSIVLANLVHGGTPIPELYQSDCTGRRIAETIEPLLRDSPERREQLAALDVINTKARGDGILPSLGAAQLVLEQLRVRASA